MSVPSIKQFAASALASAVLCLAAAPISAEFYKYRDAFGRLHLTDQPMKKSEGFDLLWRSGDDPRFVTYSRIDTAALKRNRSRYAALIDKVANRTGLRTELLHAMVRAESAYDPRALSKKGAQGLMQLMPATARRYAVSNSWDPEQNLDGGARYLRDLLDMFDDDLKLAVAAYNAGENAVKKYGNQIPPYPETQTYVRRVVAFYRQGEKVVTAYPAPR